MLLVLCANFCFLLPLLVNKDEYIIFLPSVV